MKARKKTRMIHLGGVPIGGEAPVSVQSMTKTDTRDARSTARQIRALAGAGCEIIRIAVPDIEAALALGRIKKSSPIPVIADIHFDWRLALEALAQGVDGLRINPGNIGARWKVAEVVTAARDGNVPIRIGVNAGSLSKKLLGKYGRPVPEALVESAARCPSRHPTCPQLSRPTGFFRADSGTLCISGYPRQAPPSPASSKARWDSGSCCRRASVIQCGFLFRRTLWKRCGSHMKS
jgi:hypothetical protein